MALLAHFATLNWPPVQNVDRIFCFRPERVGNGGRLNRRQKVELFEQIRREYEYGVGTIKGVARKFGVHRRMVRDAIANADPPARKAAPRERPKLGAASAVNKGHPVNRRNRRVRSEFLGLRAEPWGSNTPALHISRQTGERPPTAKTCGMWRISATGGTPLLSIISRRGVGNATIWLPGMDSNHDSRLQRPLSYH